MPAVVAGVTKLPGISKLPLVSRVNGRPIVPVAPHLNRAVAPVEVTISSALWPPHVPVATSPDDFEQPVAPATATAAASVRILHFLATITLGPSAPWGSFRRRLQRGG